MQIWFLNAATGKLLPGVTESIRWAEAHGSKATKWMFASAAGRLAIRWKHAKDAEWLDARVIAYDT